MSNRSCSLPVCVAAFALAALPAVSAPTSAEPFVGRWALTIPGGGAGWLGVEESGGKLTASILWGGGSVVPVQNAEAKDGALVLTRLYKEKVKDAGGNEREVTTTETITAKVAGDAMELVTEKVKEGGAPFGREVFKGKRIAPLGPRPDLAKVRFGPPQRLFNGRDLTGWRLVEPKADNGWSVADGVLMNRIQQGKHHGNLRTEAEFGDFQLTLEVRTQERSNSGIYLRGIYEVQIAETYGRPVDSHNMGALYSRITPSVAAEKPVGEWQTLAITLVQRHLTVVLNGKTIIDNQPVLGCTGGALTSDETKPGPLYLQGDHTNIDYRNIVLRPVLRRAG